MDWLFKSRPVVIKVCTYCGGPYGLIRPARGLCSTYCAAWTENERRDRMKPPDELVALLRYPP